MKYINQLVGFFSGLFYCLPVMVSAFFVSSTLASDTPLSGGERLGALMAEIKTFQAEFQQRVFSEAGNEIDYAAGDFYIERPNHFRWHIKESFEQLIVADGDHVFTYDPELEQVTVQNQSKLLANSPLLLLTSSRESLSESFLIEASDLPVEANDLEKILFSLKPKNTEGVFAGVNILFEQGVMKELLLLDSIGQKTVVSFSAQKKNPQLDVALFSFVMPEGVDVIDSRTRQAEN